MTCDQISEDLSAYLDGELPADARTAVESHLTACAACRTQLEELKSLAGSLQDLPRYTAPASLVGAVQERVQKSPAPLILIGGGSPIVNASGETMQPRSMWGPVAFGIAAVLMLFALAFAVMPALSTNSNPTAMRGEERRRMVESDKIAGKTDQKDAPEENAEKLAMAPAEPPRQSAAPAAAQPAVDANRLKALDAAERDRGMEKQRSENLDRVSIGNDLRERGAGAGGGLEAPGKPDERLRKATLKESEFKKASSAQGGGGKDTPNEGAVAVLQLQQEKQADGKPAANGAEMANKKRANDVDALEDAKAAKSEFGERSGGSRRLSANEPKPAATAGPNPFGPSAPPAPPAPVTAAAPFAQGENAAPTPAPSTPRPAPRAALAAGEARLDDAALEKAAEVRKSKTEPLAKAPADKAVQEPGNKGAAAPQPAKELAAKEGGDKDPLRAEERSVSRGVRPTDQEQADAVARRAIGAAAPPPPGATAPTATAAPANSNLAGGKPGAGVANDPQSPPAAKKAQAAAKDKKEVALNAEMEERPRAKPNAPVRDETGHFGGAAQNGIPAAMNFRTSEPQQLFAKIDQLARQHGGTAELNGNNLRAHIPAASRAAFIQKVGELQAPAKPAENAKRIAEPEPKREIAQKADAADPAEVTLMLVIVSPDAVPAAKAAPAEKAIDD